MRRLVDTALVALLAVLAGVGALRWLDVAVGPIVALQDAAPFVVVGLVLLAATAALLRRWWILLVTSAVLAVALAIAVPGYFSSADPKAPKDLGVMVADLREGKADAPELMDAVRARGIDVLVLLEATPDAIAALGDRGLDRELPSSVGKALPGSAKGTVVYSRLPLKQVGTTGSGDAPEQPVMTVQVGSVSVTLRAVHLPDPASGAVSEWRDGLRGLAQWERATSGPTLLAGGFAADWGNPGFRVLVDDLQDAHRTAGLGWVRTCPMVGSRLPPYLQPDHLLSRDLTVVEAGQVAIHGTDHALVWASYAVSAR